MRKDSAFELDCESGAPRVELATRESAGASVTLLWSPATDVIAVVVVDPRRSESFEIVVDAADRPLEVFYHPYAVAAARGLDLAGGRDRSELVLDPNLSHRCGQ
jgi:hypothetical protein